MRAENARARLHAVRTYQLARAGEARSKKPAVSCVSAGLHRVFSTTANEIIIHPAAVCPYYQAGVRAVAVCTLERQQVIDIPLAQRCRDTSRLAQRHPGSGAGREAGKVTISQELAPLTPAILPDCAVASALQALL
jgi:hypothetical protein